MRGARLVAVVAVCFLPALVGRVAAQSEPEYCMEFGVGIGMMNYEGDFNGNLFGCPSFSAALLYRYLFTPYCALRASVDYGQMKGNAHGNTSVFLDEYRAYTFNNTLVDADVVFEYNFWPYGTGRDYRGAKRCTPYVLGGIGLTYAHTTSGSVCTANVPLGVGVKFKVARRVNLNLEWAVHFSLSDRLDGVKDPRGVPSSGLFKNTDCYSQLMVNLTYSFKERCRVCHNDKE